MKKEDYNNTVIKCESPKHGKEIIEFYESLGFDNRINLDGSLVGSYYGVVYNKDIIKYFSACPNYVKVITLPEEKTFPREMWVWDHDDFSGKEKKVVYADNGENGFRFIAKNPNTYGGYVGYKNASDEEPFQKVKISKSEAEKILNCNRGVHYEITD